MGKLLKMLCAAIGEALSTELACLLFIIFASGAIIVINGVIVCSLPGRIKAQLLNMGV